MRSVTIAVLLIPQLLACGDDDREPSSASESTASEPQARSEEPQRQPSRATPGAPNAGGITWDAPEPFRAQRPSNEYRNAEYVFPEEAGEEAGTLTVSHFAGRGGSVEDNVSRWVNQMRQPDGSDSRQAAEITTREISGMQVTLVDVTGTFNTAGMGRPARPRENQRMLAALVEGPEGHVFFKMVGDSSLMERAEGPFEGLITSLRPN